MINPFKKKIKPILEQKADPLAFVWNELAHKQFEIDQLKCAIAQMSFEINSIKSHGHHHQKTNYCGEIVDLHR